MHLNDSRVCEALSLPGAQQLTSEKITNLIFSTFHNQPDIIEKLLLLPAAQHISSYQLCLMLRLIYTDHSALAVWASLPNYQLINQEDIFWAGHELNPYHPDLIKIFLSLPAARTLSPVQILHFLDQSADWQDWSAATSLLLLPNSLDLNAEQIHNLIYRLSKDSSAIEQLFSMPNAVNFTPNHIISLLGLFHDCPSYVERITQMPAAQRTTFEDVIDACRTNQAALYSLCFLPVFQSTEDQRRQDFEIIEETLNRDDIPHHEILDILWKVTNLGLDPESRPAKRRRISSAN